MTAETRSTCGGFGGPLTTWARRPEYYRRGVLADGQAPKTAKDSELLRQGKVRKRGSADWRACAARQCQLRCHTFELELERKRPQGPTLSSDRFVFLHNSQANTGIMVPGLK